MSGSGTGGLDWFAFETKMRQVVREIVEPTITRSHEDREVVGSLKKMLEAQEARVNDIEIALFKSD